MGGLEHAHHLLAQTGFRRRGFERRQEQALLRVRGERRDEADPGRRAAPAATSSSNRWPLRPGPPWPGRRARNAGRIPGPSCSWARTTRWRADKPHPVRTARPPAEELAAPGCGLERKHVGRVGRRPRCRARPRRPCAGSRDPGPHSFRGVPAARARAPAYAAAAGPGTPDRVPGTPVDRSRPAARSGCAPTRPAAPPDPSRRRGGG